MYAISMKQSSRNNDIAMKQKDPSTNNTKIPNKHPNVVLTNHNTDMHVPTQRNNDVTTQQSNDEATLVIGKCTKASNITKCISVRLCLVYGNAFAAWRTVLEVDDTWLWGWFLLCAVLMMIECAVIIYKRLGVEWTWWCPCFVVFLATTLPLIWKIQIQQHYTYVEEQEKANIRNGNVIANITRSTTIATTLPYLRLEDISLNTLISLERSTWVILVTDSVVYLIICARWFLPRGKISREFLAGMLLEYVAISSDIMELLAVFDETPIRSDLQLHYWILSVWSISFMQFIPVLLHKQKHGRVKSPHMKCVTNHCGNSLAEIVNTCMSIFFQDGPFFALRLYIIIGKNLITYSLIFFLLKNILSLILLFYRLLMLCCKLPCRKKALHRSNIIEYDIEM